MKKLCEWEQATEIVIFEKKNELIKKRTAEIIWKCKKFVIFEKTKFKINFENKVSEHCHYTAEYRSATNSICNSKRSVLKESPIVFQNVSNCDQHFTCWRKYTE